MLYKPGTRIDLQKEAQRRERMHEFKADAINTAFWAGLIVLFLYCLYA